MTAVETAAFESDAVSVSVEPGVSHDSRNEPRSFTVTVTSASDTRVTWSATGGTISGSGGTITDAAPATASAHRTRGALDVYPTPPGANAVFGADLTP